MNYIVKDNINTVLKKQIEKSANVCHVLRQTRDFSGVCTCILNGVWVVWMWRPESTFDPQWAERLRGPRKLLAWQKKERNLQNLQGPQSNSWRIRFKIQQLQSRWLTALKKACWKAASQLRFLAELLRIFTEDFQGLVSLFFCNISYLVFDSTIRSCLRPVDLLCRTSNFCFIGPENFQDERIVVFIHVGPETKQQYDGHTATDEVQFPLLMAEFAKSASLPALQKKFVNLMAIRYHILCASLQTHPDVHPIKRLPVPTYSGLRKLLKQSSDIFDEMCTAIPK